jgi:hypothetical protein
MKKLKKELLVNEELKMKGRLTDAICQVQVFRDEDGKHNVILSKPDIENYRGVSTTNYFENFATKVKESFLSQVNPLEIKWYDYQEWSSKNMENPLISVELDYERQTYTNPNFMGKVCLN